MLPNDDTECQLSLFEWAESVLYEERQYGFGGFDEYFTSDSSHCDEFDDTSSD